MIGRFYKARECERHKQARWLAGNIVNAGMGRPNQQKWDGLYHLANEFVRLTQLQRCSLLTRPAKDEQAVMVCPQCEGEGGYADGLDEAACHTDCTRCGTNGWIVDLAALIEARDGEGSAPHALPGVV